MAQHGKRYNDSRGAIDRENLYSPVEAIRLLKGSPDAKFDETVEVHMNLGLNVRHADEQLRGTMMLPHGTGREQRVAVFAEGEKARLKRRAPTSSARPISRSASRRASPTSTSRSRRPTRWGTSAGSAACSARAG